MSIILNIIFFSVLSYFFFYFIFFFIFSIVYVDTLIGISMLFLFYLIYFFFNKVITNYFIMRSRSIFVFFFRLIFLAVNMKRFVLRNTKSLLEFLIYKFNGLNLSSLNLNFHDYKITLYKSFLFNNINNLLLSKLLIIDKFNKVLNSYEKILFIDNVNFTCLMNNFFLYLFK